jgi:hypothetical protein
MKYFAKQFMLLISLIASVNYVFAYELNYPDSYTPKFSTTCINKENYLLYTNVICPEGWENYHQKNKSVSVNNEDEKLQSSNSESSYKDINVLSAESRIKKNEVTSKARKALDSYGVCMRECAINKYQADDSCVTACMMAHGGF